MYMCEIIGVYKSTDNVRTVLLLTKIILYKKNHEIKRRYIKLLIAFYYDFFRKMLQIIFSY